MQRLLCIRCGDSIHPDTAARNAGLCLPCVRGNQLSIEERRVLHDSAKETERARISSPEYRYWHELVNQVYKREDGYNTLTHGDRVYYLVNVLCGEVYNGGFDQFFSNSSGNRYVETAAALLEVGAAESLDLLQQAKQVLFGEGSVPVDEVERYQMMRKTIESQPEAELKGSMLDNLDSDFYKDPDNLSDVLQRIASKFKLYPSDA